MNEISNVSDAPLPTFSTVALVTPFTESATFLTWLIVAGRVTVWVICDPEVKSIPSFNPRPPTASAPTSRMTPDIVKK